MGSAEPLGEKWPADSFGKVHPSERNKWVGIFFLLFFLVEVGLFRLAYRYVPEFVELFTPYLRTYWLQFLFLSAIVVLSITLFKFRERYRELYGLTELAFGCVSAWLAIPEVIQYKSNWPLIIGSMYINVRGLDNWNQGRAKRLERKTDAPELASQRCSLSNF